MLAIVLAVGLSGCTGEPAAEPVAASLSPTGSPSATPSPSGSASPTPTLPPGPTPTPHVQPTAQPEPTAAPAPAQTAAPGQPAAWPEGISTVTHGAQVHAAYVAVTESRDDPRWAQSRRQVEDLGYVASGGELACDSGAAEALGLDPQMLGVAVYFRSAADAQTFARMYEPGVVGTAPVTLFCLD